jgi:hypothetical protein
MNQQMTLQEALAYVQSVSIPTEEGLDQYRLAWEVIVENRHTLPASMRIFIPEGEDHTPEPSWDKVVAGSQPLYRNGSVRVVHNHDD